MFSMCQDLPGNRKTPTNTSRLCGRNIQGQGHQWPPYGMVSSGMEIA